MIILLDKKNPLIRISAKKSSLFILNDWVVVHIDQLKRKKRLYRMRGLIVKGKTFYFDSIASF